MTTELTENAPDTIIEAADDQGGVTLPPGTPSGSGTGFPSINIVQEMRQSYRDYSMSVIVGRALPDIRDGLKPVHRRILYAMYGEGLLSNRKYSKCAGVVGEVLKKYHPHGDSAVYDALVRMAQPWNMRAPLIDGQGNFGSVDGDSAAAYRYTESKLQKIAEELLRDIEKETVDFIPNFDDTTKEPSVLPTRIPNLLVNGSEGIAVAMATRCPPHNLGEVIDALLHVIDADYFGGEEVTMDSLLQRIPGPDFPTGGMICGRAGIYSAFAKGRGSIKLRGRAEIVDNEKSKRTQIIINEIPFQVNKAKLVEKIAQLARDKKIEGIAEIRDESDRNGMQIAIDLKRDAVADVVLNQLYKHTALQVSFPVNMLAIVNGQPKVLSLLETLKRFVDFRREVVTRRSRYELKEAQKRFHIIAGLLVALDDIDKVIDIIRSSKTTAEAKSRLQTADLANVNKIALFVDGPTDQVDGWLKQGFARLDETQAAAILEMRLSRLVGLERDKLSEEGQTILTEVLRLKKILSDLPTLMGVIREEMVTIRDSYAMPRRTEITEAVEDIDLEDLIAEEDAVVTVSHLGYVKRSKLAIYSAQKRGGKGRSAAKTKDEDFVKDVFVASTHAYLLLFTNKGKVYWLKVHRIPETSPTAKGRPIINLVELDKDERIEAILPVREFPKEEGQAFIVTCSVNGKVKKTDLVKYARPRSVGLLGAGVAEGDNLLAAHITKGDSEIMLTTTSGQAIRFSEADVREMGRTATGVKGIELSATDRVVSMNIVDEEAPMLVVTENGYGKRTAITDYPTQRRGGKGVISIKTTERNGAVAGVINASDHDELMAVSNGGKAIRLAAKEISVMGRNTQGVRILNVNQGEHVVGVARIVNDDELDEQSN